MSRRRMWLVGLALALVAAFGTMLILKSNSDSASGQIGSRGNVVGGILILLLFAGASARRRRRREEGQGDDG